MSLDHIKNFVIPEIDNINHYSKAIKIMNTLIINWETDITKMNISELSSNCTWRGKIIGIKHIPPFSSQPHWDCKMTELLYFIQNTTEKIIPPFLKISYRVQNKKKTENESYLMDGNHRALLASIMKLDSIPVIVFEETIYVYEAGKYYLSNNDKMLFVKDANGIIIEQFKLLDIDYLYTDRDKQEIHIRIAELSNFNCNSPLNVLS